MRRLLLNHFGYNPRDIVILTEVNQGIEIAPTKKNIQKYMNWLLEDCKDGDYLVFFFSGHGSRQPNFTGDELDGFDETICPVDYMNEGKITENEIYSTIVEPLPEGVTLHAITYILVDTVKNYPEITYGELLDCMHKFLEDMNQKGCLARRMLRRRLVVSSAVAF
ncbi:hypothetical protein K2173_022230 [Erythroxylum novogranatense]|uniref:Peptidase C14 caspase domain-containing protein n=1 Tax=Erythroxylum novogranatense TaxID=1862640 RepID=A0AAV8STP0_9ROSI|nr:hypothetical protein K2173_022230 [Erythroxylum novogranatense]